MTSLVPVRPLRISVDQWNDENVVAEIHALTLLLNSRIDTRLA